MGEQLLTEHLRDWDPTAVASLRGDLALLVVPAPLDVDHARLKVDPVDAQRPEFAPPQAGGHRGGP